MLSTVRYLAFGLVLPLATIHLWLATVREGLWPAVRRIGTHLSRAFAPQSVLIYIVGFLFLGSCPISCFSKPHPQAKRGLKFSFWLRGWPAVFALTLFGWVITVWALSLSSTRPPHRPVDASPRRLSRQTRLLDVCTSLIARTWIVASRRVLLTHAAEPAGRTTSASDAPSCSLRLSPLALAAGFV